MEILDPQRFIRGQGEIEPAQLEPVMVRRLKEDLRRLGQTFPERRIEPVVIDGLPETAPELILATKLAEYRDLRRKRLEGETVIGALRLNSFGLARSSGSCPRSR